MELEKLIQRAEASLSEQTATLQKKIEKLAKENYEQAEWLYERGSKHLGVLSELINLVKSLPYFEDEIGAKISVSTLQESHKYSADLVERMSIAKARESQPWLFDSQEAVYKTAQPMRLMKDGTLEPINKVAKKITQ